MYSYNRAMKDLLDYLEASNTIIRHQSAITNVASDLAAITRAFEASTNFFNSADVAGTIALRISDLQNSMFSQFAATLGNNVVMYSDITEILNNSSLVEMQKAAIDAMVVSHPSPYSLLAETMLPKFDFVMRDYPAISNLLGTSFVDSLFPMIDYNNLTFSNIAAVHLLGDLSQQIEAKKSISLPRLLLDFRFPDFVSNLLPDIDAGDNQEYESDENESKQQLQLSPTLFVADISLELLQALPDPVEVLQQLTPEKFELIVLELLRKMGWRAERHTNHANRRDGGIDIIAWQPPNHTFVVVQVKHHAKPKNKVGAPEVRDLLGVIEGNELFSSAMLVTNTTFTDGALNWQKKHPYKLHLKNIELLTNWIHNNFSDVFSYSHIPNSIELGGGIRIEKSLFTPFILKQ